MGFHKSTLVARGAKTQLDRSCISAPPTTNVDLFACFAERFFKSSSISYLPAGAQPAIVCMWACRPCGQQTEQPKQRNIGTELNRMSRDVSSTVKQLRFHIDGHVIQYQYLTMFEDVAVSCEMQMILNILSVIEPAHLSSGHQSTFHRLYMLIDVHIIPSH